MTLLALTEGMAEAEFLLEISEEMADWVGLLALTRVGLLEAVLTEAMAAWLPTTLEWVAQVVEALAQASHQLHQYRHLLAAQVRLVLLVGEVVVFLRLLEQPERLARAAMVDKDSFASGHYKEK
jgi:hypothetical protein